MDDPFAILDLPRRFDVDERQLQDRFVQRSSANHPDRFSDPLAQAEAAEHAAAINAAYRTLADPESRANALLRLLGGPAKEDDRSLPPDLLMDMMETRERMEQAIAANDQATLDELRDWAGSQRRAHLQTIARHFAEAGDDSISDDLAARIRLELNALRYIERMLEQIPD